MASDSASSPPTVTPRSRNALVGFAASKDDYRLVEGLPAVVAGRAWTIPPPVPSFTGRDEQLAALRDQLTGQGAAALVPAPALSGTGGLGKTELALAYAQRYRGDYELGWWVPSETELAMLTALAELGVALGLSPELPSAELAARALDVLGERSGWLLVFDSATDPDAVGGFLPQAGGGHVLVTSRDSAWRGMAEPVPVDLLPLDEAVGLLGRRSGDQDEQAAERLPQALDQAAAQAVRQDLELARYLELFDQRRAELLAGGKPLAYQGTVDTAVSLVLDQVRETNPAALWLAQLCALLAPDKIPVDLLLGDAELLPEQLAAAVVDPPRREQLLGELYQQGLLTRDVADTSRMHRLVQDIILARLGDADRQGRTAEAVGLLAELFPYQGSEPASWPRCAQLLAHAQAVLGRARTSQLTSAALAGLLARTGVYLRDRGLSVRLAGQLHEQALAMYQRLYEGDHPHVADSLGNLAFDLTELGEYGRARDLSEQALAMEQRLSDGDDPHVAASLTNLAYAVRILGEYGRARELDEQALAMYQRLHEGDHLDVAASLNNLAIDLRRLGEHGRARELNVQALAMRRGRYNGEHGHVAASLNNLAIDLTELGEYERARELNVQALAMRQRLHKGDHPDVATSLNNLAIDMTELGKYERALQLDEQALAMRQRLFHGDHPAVAQSLANLAVDLQELGQDRRAEELDEQAMAMRQRLGEAERRSP